MSIKRVKPKEGVVVRYPKTYGILPVEGADVPWTGDDGRYWRRRAIVGDVEIIPDKETVVESEISYSELSTVKKIRNNKMEEK